MELMEQARELGLALANTNEFVRMKEAQAMFSHDDALSALLREVEEKRAQLVRMMEQGTQDNTVIELSNDLERLQGQLEENPLLTELTESQRAFSALITAVDEEINACIGASNGCAGDCGSCGGCHQ